MISDDTLLAAHDGESREPPPRRILEVEGVAMANAFSLKNGIAGTTQGNRGAISAGRGGDEIADVGSGGERDHLSWLRPLQGRRQRVGGGYPHRTAAMAVHLHRRDRSAGR